MQRTSSELEFRANIYKDTKSEIENVNNGEPKKDNKISKGLKKGWGVVGKVFKKVGVTVEKGFKKIA
jgi:hypothetical protein